ncbi:hypothetical protein [Jezberella montanilacus]|uniref:hypothetical protein n=1 Tax=Jezberella montanilacus TaxID=323426 RepID=UPI0021809C11|nr:hypothetical protein [Jezberella montanilacus]
MSNQSASIVVPTRTLNINLLRTGGNGWTADRLSCKVLPWGHLYWGDSTMAV